MNAIHRWIYYSNSSIRSLCPTHWTVCTGAMQAIVGNYEILQSTMEVASHGTDDCAGGVIAIMDKFSTYIGLKFSPVLIFSMIEQLSVTLQVVITTINDCYSAVELCIRALQLINLNPSLMLLKKRQPIYVILQFYPEGDNCLDKLMMVVLNMCLKIYIERNILRLLTVLRENLRGPSTKTTFFCKELCTKRYKVNV